VAVESKSVSGRAGWRLEPSYARLPAPFHVRVKPTPVAVPRWVVFNRALAVSLGLDPAVLGGGDGLLIFSGNAIPDGADPIAQAYSGHQFGHFTRLGDGRAILLGEHLDPQGRRWDIQLKGAGRTPYSRGGDGRAALGPMLREHLVSEAMHALGIPTTRSLAVVATGEPVFRERPLPGAILTRVAASHIRVGTFEHFASMGDVESLRLLVDHALARHDPDRLGNESPALGLLEGVMDRQVALVVEWLRVGFVHGVMNTDNMAISGETLDYGPCAFIDAFHPGAVFSSIDHDGRYAFGQQPNIVGWNLSRLASALLPVVDPDRDRALGRVRELMGTFPERFGRRWQTMMRSKLGLSTEEAGDAGLIEDLMDWMREHRADYTNTFRALVPGGLREPGADAGWSGWLDRWEARLERQGLPVDAVVERMKSVNPVVIPRNERVEEALEAAVDGGDMAPLDRLLKVLATPYDPVGKPAEYFESAADGGAGYRTFCGT